MAKGVPDYGVYSRNIDPQGRVFNPSMTLIGIYVNEDFYGTLSWDTYVWTGKTIILTSASDYIKFRFNGTFLGLLIRKTPASGILRVKIDGSTYTTVDCYDSSYINNYITTISDSLSSTTHLCELEWTGQKNASSGGYDVEIAGYFVDGSVNMNNTLPNSMLANEFYNRAVAGQGLFVRRPDSLTLATGQVTVSTTATNILTTSSISTYVLLKNISSTTVYIGDSNVTTTTGYPLEQNETLDLTGWWGDIYGIVSTGSATVAYLHMKL